ncbi:hypothetical protein [Hymenobacter radiodurans]|nr:hypothetical protein [Hymenobacter radiodurans]
MLLPPANIELPSYFQALPQQLLVAGDLRLIQALIGGEKDE